MAHANPSEITAEAYLEGERTAEFKSEFRNGHVFAMTGASVPHNIISMNIANALYNALADRDCLVFHADVKVQIEEAAHYVYPDVSVVCGPIEYGMGREDVIANPFLVVEVLSQSTQDYDRGSKFAAYRNLPSLRDYLIVDQYRVLTEHFHRIREDDWNLNVRRHLSDSVHFDFRNIRLNLQNIYRNTGLTDAAS
ncbi:MAG: Uma2 family endonuclease [Desulfococcaceae bacterium]